MYDQLLLENYKLDCIRCKACDFSKNARSALLSFKPLKLAKLLLQQLGYNKTVKFNKWRPLKSLIHFYRYNPGQNIWNKME